MRIAKANGLLMCVIALLLAGLAYAQTETGQITGTVMDPTGAVIPSATVTLKSTSTGLTRQVSSSEAGVFVFTNLQPGTYQVAVSARGFSGMQQQAVVTVGSRIGLDFHLEVGQSETIVQVAESSTPIDTETQTIGAVVTNQQIIELPTITRNPYDLVSTVGNINGGTPDERGVGYAINGQRSASTNILLDGVANNDEFTATVGQHVPLDSVQEFSVLTSNFTAEYGRASGGIVNVATRSGSNEFHGSAYEFGRYSRLASNEFDNNANGIGKPVFTRNQFGFSVGGPVTPKLKDKLFFFHNTEWTRVRSSAFRTVWIPTPDLINQAAPATQDFFTAYGQLRSSLVNLGTFTKGDFAGENYDVCRGLAAGSKCAALPAGTPLFQRVAYNYPSDSGGGYPQNTYMTVTRIDYNLSDKTQMYWRYSRESEFDFDGTISDSPYAGFDSPNTQMNNSVVWSVTHTFSPTFISQSKVNFNRFNNQQPFSGHGAVPTLYWGSANVATSILGTDVALPGYLPFTPGNGIPFGGPQNFVQFYEDMSWVKGKHAIRFGGSYSYLRDNRTFGAYETGIEVLGNSVAKGTEGFLNGTLYNFMAAVNPQGKFPCGATATPDCTLTLPVGPPNFSRSNRYNDWALYAQDSWKVSPHVTLNYGLRWEIFGTQHNKDPKLDSNYYLGTSGSIYQRIANGSVQLAPNSPLGKLWVTNYGNFAPRVGIAWDVFGDGKTSLRGGYGIGYERNFGNVTFNVIQNPPNYATLSLFGGVDLPVIPVAVSNAGPLAGSSGSKALGKVSLRAVDPNIATAYAHFWSASMEHKFGGNVLGAIEYTGSQGENQYGIANVNGAGFGNYYMGVPCSADEGDCVTRLRTTQYSGINFRTNGGNSSYNAMNMRWEVNDVGRTGLTLRANWTWSHSFDDLSDTFSSSANQYNLGWLDPFNPSLDKGDSYFDSRHRVAISGVWSIPFKGSSPVAKQILGGWSLTPMFTAYTGHPFSLFDCTNGLNACPYAMFNGPVGSGSTGLVATGTPNIYNYLSVAGKIDSSWYNPKMGWSDFGPFPGNMITRNFFRGPGSWNMDFAIHKNFQLSESKKLQFRGEFYNFFNHPNLEANTGDGDVSAIDTVTASYFGRRQVQLGIRLQF